MDGEQRSSILNDFPRNSNFILHAQIGLKTQYAEPARYVQKEIISIRKAWLGILINSPL